jgi:hypothetical protein
MEPKPMALRGFRLYENLHGSPLKTADIGTIPEPKVPPPPPPKKQ